MAEHKDKPFYIMKDEHSPMKSDWPNNIKKEEPQKEEDKDDSN